MSLGRFSEYVREVSVLQRMVCAVAHLPSKLPKFWNIVVEFGAAGREATITPEKARVLLENLEDFNEEALKFAKGSTLFLELVNFRPSCTKRSAPLGVTLMSPRQTCQKCNTPLVMRGDRPSHLVVYDDVLGTLPGTHYQKYCRKSGCHMHQYFGYHTLGDSGGVYYDPEWASLPYFVSSQRTAFSMRLLSTYDADVLIGQVSYKQRAEMYNYVHGYENASTTDDQPDGTSSSQSYMDRQSLDRRRLEDGHLCFAILQVMSWYEGGMSLETTPFLPSMNDTLASVTSSYYNNFTAKYSAHRCDTPGCHTTLVIDGNMKNHRDVCKAKDAGYVEFEGLPGAIRTGCMKTPAFKSRFCESHKPRAFTPSSDSHSQEGDQPGPSHPRSVDRGGFPVIQLVTDKRSTRAAVYYQVTWLGQEDCRSTWELASDLPPEVIAEYEDGLHAEVTRESMSYGGHTSHSLSAVLQPISGQPPNKKARAAEETHQASGPLSGTIPEAGFYQETATSGLVCNTEKDRVKLNERTAGILAGIWPCGVVVFIAELFVSESKAQVYGILHNFWQTYPESTKDISYVCYDDACHLRKYAINPSRRDCTPSTQRIANSQIVVDKMHFVGHKDTWCRNNCNPNDHRDLDKVDTEVCEQTFSWLSRYARMTRGMNQQHFMFYLLYICDLHNRRRIA